MVDASKGYRYVVLFLLLVVVINVPSLVTRTALLSTVDADVSGVDIVFVFGVKAGRFDPVNRLDTRTDVFRKDMVADPAITFSLKLSDEDMTRILDKMNEIDFHTYPQNYSPIILGPMMTLVTPYTTYQLTLYQDGVPVKTVRMDTDIWSDDTRTQNLRSLYGLIMSIIYESPEYQNSPEPTSGYC